MGTGKKKINIVAKRKFQLQVPYSQTMTDKLWFSILSFKGLNFQSVKKGTHLVKFMKNKSQGTESFS